MERAALKRPLRRGWTTGTCAAAASRAAYQALLTGAFPDPVEVLLPGGARPCLRPGGQRIRRERSRAPASSRMPGTILM